MNCGICGKRIWPWQNHTNGGHHSVCAEIDRRAFNEGYEWGVHVKTPRVDCVILNDDWPIRIEVSEDGKL